MSTRKKKERERHVINSFLDSNPVILTDPEVLNSEKPDFVIRHAQGTLGVELTQHFWSDRNGFRPKALEAEKDKLVVEIENQVRPYLKGNVWVEINMIQEYIWSAEERIELKKFLAFNILNLIANFDYSVRHESAYLDWRFLPPAIQSVHIYHHELLPYSYFYQSGGYMLPIINADDVQDIITAKDLKKRSYQDLDELWLIIWTTGLSPSVFDRLENLRNHYFCSQFDKVFYYDQGHQIIIPLELKEAPEEAP